MNVIDELEIDVKIESNIDICYYDKLLSSCNEWIAFKREILLNGLLSDTSKIQFDIDNIFLYGYIDTLNEQTNINNWAFFIKSLTFLIGSSSKVEKLTLKVIKLATTDGKIFSEIVSSGIEINIDQHIDSNNQVSFFYLRSPNTEIIHNLP